jgi:hypothetical protein
MDVTATTTPYGGYTGFGSFPTNTDLSNPLDLPGFQPTHIPLGAIIGGAAGGLIFIVFILVLGWRYRLRRRRAPPFPNLPPPQLVAPNMNRNDYDKAELAGNSAFTSNSLSKTPVARKPTPTMSVVSPVSPMTENASPLAGKLELEGQNTGLSGRTEMEAQNRSEVAGGLNTQELHPEHARYEVQGQPHAHELVNAPRYEVQGSNQHPVEVPATRANMNEGPFFELEGPYR